MQVCSRAATTAGAVLRCPRRPWLSPLPKPPPLLQGNNVVPGSEFPNYGAFIAAVAGGLGGKYRDELQST